MFTGIIEELGILRDIAKSENNFVLTVESSLSSDLKVDQSLSHNGICLTIVAVRENTHRVVAIEETINRTSMRSWKLGDRINLERSALVGGRLDGHIVQGHVDQTGRCIKRENLEGSTLFTFSYDMKEDHLTVSKGSITINGVSLTVVRSEPGLFSVAIIPYTIENTNLKNTEEGDEVNLEFDILGKYAKVYLKHYNKNF